MAKGDMAGSTISLSTSFVGREFASTRICAAPARRGQEEASDPLESELSLQPDPLSRTTSLLIK